MANDKKKLLILGAKGMLGQALVNEFSIDYEVSAWDKKELDITNSKKTVKAIKSRNPSIIINATGFTDVDAAEKNEALAMKINSEAVGNLAKISQQLKTLFIHFSTDYIFQGKKKSGYKESDSSFEPANVYGKSKLSGERLLLEQAPKGLSYYLIRTSWLFGSGGKNFVDTVLKLAQKHNELKVVDDQCGKPTYTKDLARMVRHMLEAKLDPGIYHFTNEPAMSWYEFAKLILETKKQIEPSFSAPQVLPVSSGEFPRPAKRPQFSVLLNLKLPKGRKVEDALREYLRLAK